VVCVGNGGVFLVVELPLCCLL